MIFIRNDVFIRTFLVFNNDFTIFFVYLSTQKIATEIYNLEETQKHFYSTRDPISLHIVYGVTDLFVFFFHFNGIDWKSFGKSCLFPAHAILSIRRITFLVQYF